MKKSKPLFILFVCKFVASARQKRSVVVVNKGALEYKIKNFSLKSWSVVIFSVDLWNMPLNLLPLIMFFLSWQLFDKNVKRISFQFTCSQKLVQCVPFKICWLSKVDEMESHILYRHNICWGYILNNGIIIFLFLVLSCNFRFCVTCFTRPLTCRSAGADGV